MRDLLYKRNIAYLSLEELKKFKEENKDQVIYNIVRKYIVDGVCEVSIISLSDLNKALEVFKEEFDNESRELLEVASYTEEEIEEFINEDNEYVFGDTYAHITLSDNSITMYITVNKLY